MDWGWQLFSGLGLAGSALFSTLFRVFFGLFETEGFPLDLNDLGMVDQPIDQ